MADVANKSDDLVIRIDPPLADSASRSESEAALEARDGGDDGENEDVFYSVASDEQALRDQSAPLIPSLPTNHRYVEQLLVLVCPSTLHVHLRSMVYNGHATTDTYSPSNKL